MTSTKLLVFIAAVVPFGLVAIAIYSFVKTLRRNRLGMPEFAGSTNFGRRSRHGDALFQQGRCVFLR